MMMRERLEAAQSRLRDVTLAVIRDRDDVSILARTIESEARAALRLVRRLGGSPTRDEDDAAA